MATRVACCRYCGACGRLGVPVGMYLLVAYYDLCGVYLWEMGAHQTVQNCISIDKKFD